MKIGFKNKSFVYSFSKYIFQARFVAYKLQHLLQGVLKRIFLLKSKLMSEVKKGVAIVQAN